MMRIILGFVFILLAWLAFNSCEKSDNILSGDSKLEFSTDTVLFDTIFTTIGSTTLNFRVHNKSGQDFEVEKIYLAGGSASKFRLNVNGEQEVSLKDYIIPAQDSIFIFVEVTLDPNNVNDPMVIQDSIVFEHNGKIQDVDLIAFGQDVNLINGETIQSQEWTSDKPYLVYNYIIIDTAQTLTIHPGTRIHFHKQSSMIVEGTLKALGTQEEPISFLGDRLESGYDNIAGQWGYYAEYEDGSLLLLGGIHFTKISSENEIRHSIIKNAIKGIQVDSLASTARPKLTISHSRVENMTVTGLDARFTSVLADNCLFANCGTHCIGLFLGGAYEFYHCTISNDNVTAARTHPALVLTNFYVFDGQAYVYDLQNALFANCIIYGGRQMEIELWNTIDNVAVPGKFNYKFDHCLVQVDTLKTDNEDHWVEIIKDLNPVFDSLPGYSYRLDSASNAQDRGSFEYAQYFPLDLDGNNRLEDGNPDIGAYERIEIK